MSDVSFWKEQLAHEMRDMNAEIEHLLERKAVMEKMLFDSQRSLAIAEECMLQREKRTGIDQTFDEPEKGLCKVGRFRRSATNLVKDVVAVLILLICMYYVYYCILCACVGL